jgi:hypothetical protein
MQLGLEEVIHQSAVFKFYVTLICFSVMC